VSWEVIYNAQSPLALKTKTPITGRIHLFFSNLALRKDPCFLLFLKVKGNFANVEARWYSSNHAWTLVLVVRIHHVTQYAQNNHFSLVGPQQTFFWYHSCSNTPALFLVKWMLVLLHFPRDISIYQSWIVSWKELRFYVSKEIKTQTKKSHSSERNFLLSLYLLMYYSFNFRRGFRIILLFIITACSVLFYQLDIKVQSCKFLNMFLNLHVTSCFWNHV